MCPNQMNKEYLKPVIRLLSMKTNRLLGGSPLAGHAGSGDRPGEGEKPVPIDEDNPLFSRFGFWDDIDDNLLEDIEGINDYD